MIPSWGIDKRMYIHTIEYYSGMKGNEMPTCTATCLNLQHARAAQEPDSKDEIGNPFLRHCHEGKTIGTENRSEVVARGSGWGEG